MTTTNETRYALLSAAALIEERASYDSGYRNPSEGDLAWKRGMHHAAKMLRDQAYGTHEATGLIRLGLILNDVPPGGIGPL